MYLKIILIMVNDQKLCQNFEIWNSFDYLINLHKLEMMENAQ